MKTVVAICIYNRFENLKTWINCWSQSNTGGAELVIVHNYYNDQQLRRQFEIYCQEGSVTYVPRVGQGFDIGAFQDICRQRLKGFPDFDYLLWCCDDCIPMSKDFITPFIEKLQEGVGISCMQIAKSTAAEIHVRTTGFCMSKEVARRLTFPADPVTTKQHCYLFEHRGGKNTLTNQVRAMGLSCEMVAKASVSPLWDQGYWRRLNRLHEHHAVFGGKQENNKVIFICPIYDAYPQIISSLICQNENNWELLLIDDHPGTTDTKKIVESYGDQRIKYVKKERVGNYGHPLRKWALEEIKDKDYGFVCISNPDNYYTPNFIKEIRKGFKQSHTAVAVYTDKMVHSYKNWDVIPCKLERGYIDCGGVVIKKSVACEVGWTNTSDHSADWLFFQEIANKYSWSNFKPIHGCLFIHN